MWLCVDRVEGDTVVLVDDEAKAYRLTRAAYVALTGLEPLESAMLSATLHDGRVVSAVPDEAEAERRRAAARTRLNSLFRRAPK